MILKQTLSLHKTIPGEVFFDELRKKHIFVRRFGNNPRIKDYLRISIGTQKEMEILVQELEKIEKMH